MTLNIVILLLVTLERLAELPYARSNTKQLLAKGGHEVAPGHYPALVALHVAWLGSLWWLAPGRPVDMVWLAVFALIEIGRAWVLVSLGRRWTTRIITVPGETLVRTGPYRFLAHPNYVVVVGEIAVLPMVFGLWQVSLLFSLANAILLWIRIRAENRALERLRT